MNFRYSVNMSWSDSDGCYVATVPEFPGLSAFGDTPERAAAEAHIAAQGFIDVYNEDGCALPEPIKAQSFSGQTRIRLPKSLHAALSQQAVSEGVSMNNLINCLLSERLALRKVKEAISDLKTAVTLAYYTDKGQPQQVMGCPVRAACHGMPSAVSAPFIDIHQNRWDS